MKTYSEIKREFGNRLLIRRVSKLVKAEGDKWEGQIEGLPAFLMRHEKGQHWFGGVQLPAYHRYHGVRLGVCTRVPQCLPKTVEFLKPPNNEIFECDHRLVAIFKKMGDKVPHGGIVNAGEVRNRTGWWWGFDCGHQDDLSPALLKLPNVLKLELPQYRSKEFAMSELGKLGKLIKELGAHA